MDIKDIKEVARVITELADKTKWSINMGCTSEEAFAFAHLAKIAKEPERKEGELTREEAMIAYCSGKKIRVMTSAHDTGYDAWLVGQTPWVQFDHDSYPANVPLFLDSHCCFEIVPEPPVLVDGLRACKAYREGKSVKRDYVVYDPSLNNHHLPDFVLDDWEIID